MPAKIVYYYYFSSKYSIFISSLIYRAIKLLLLTPKAQALLLKIEDALQQEEICEIAGP
jgi:hypothetical protein